MGDGDASLSSTSTHDAAKAKICSHLKAAKALTSGLDGTLGDEVRTRELVDRRELDSKSYADLLTELHGEVCTANTGAAARAAAARARWNRPVT